MNFYVGRCRKHTRSGWDVSSLTYPGVPRGTHPFHLLRLQGCVVKDTGGLFNQVTSALGFGSSYLASLIFIEPPRAEGTTQHLGLLLR